MKTLKQVISLILFIMFGISAVFNILFLFHVITETWMQVVFVILLLVVFIISILGIILKNIRKEDRVSINITTPARELGVLYSSMLIIWVITYFLALILK